jgi:hypothetical protein
MHHMHMLMPVIGAVAARSLHDSHGVSHTAQWHTPWATTTCTPCLKVCHSLTMQQVLLAGK